MRLAFIGCVDFSVACLSHLLARRYRGVDMVGAATANASAMNTDFQSLEPLARQCDLPLLVTSGRNQTELAAWVKERRPDIVFCLGWSYLLGRDILDVPPMGVVGYHATPLPKNRGRHPLIWTLALGLDETASTFFFMDEGADSGDILSQRPVVIEKADDAGSLYRKLTACALEQMDDFVPRLVNGTYDRVPQDHSRANYWRKRSKADGAIDWRMPATGIVNLVRALAAPYPGAHCVHEGRDVKIWSAVAVEWPGAENIEPGKVLVASADTFVVKCGVGAVSITEHEFAAPPNPGSYL